MSDLFTTEKERVLKKRFYGRRLKVNEVVGRAVEIIDYEITTGSNSRNELLCLQLKMDNRPFFFWSEGIKLIKTIKAANRVDLPFNTKICWDDNGKYLIFKKTCI